MHSSSVRTPDQREILYRLLVGDHGARLRQIVTAGSQSQQITRAIG